MKRKIMITVISVMLIFSLIPQAFAQEQANKQSIQQILNLGSVSVRSGVTFEVNNLLLIPSDNGQSIGFTLTVINNSNTELDFINYWVDLSSKSGAKFSVSLATQDATKVSAKSSKDITFYSNIGADIKPSDLKIRIVEWDFSYPDFKKTLGEISVPTNYDYVTRMNEGRIVSLGETRLSIQVERAVIGKSEKYYRPDLKIAIKNEGKRSVTIPELEFAIITSDGLMYPMNTGQLSGTVLTPLSDKDFRMSVSIPIEVDQENWKLAIINPIKDRNLKIPLAVFELQEKHADSNIDLGKYYTFSNTDGTYQIKLNSMNRLPLEDYDLLVANLTLANDSDKSLPLPSLGASFHLDDNIELDGTIDSNDKIISIPSQQTVDIQAVTKIPYTYAFSEVDLKIQQIDSGNESLDLVEFNYDGEFDKIPVVAERLVIEEVGYRSNVAIKGLYNFKGNNANIIAAEIEVENLEKRQSDIQKFSGYFEMNDGTIYPADFYSVDEKIFPNGKGMIYAYSTVPKTFDTSKLSLVLGKAVEQTSAEESQLIGYVNPNRFNLPDEKKPKTDLKNIDVAPYTIAINRIATQARFDLNQVFMEFDYDIERDVMVRSGLKDHNIIIELVDAENKTSFTRKLNIVDDQEKANSTTLAVGSRTIKLDPWTDEAFVLDISVVRDFQLNIYIQFETGYKTLIATETVPWFVNRTFK